ncbi:hypothetical protein MKW94_005086 [Papaver nudicaule]|uniref:Cupin type-1 domain-containing protein n=1 Tax=Papaver nudicaule TaxID=74823 RepID=A0AA42B4G7_PAPNU|nr:hypothetical protein [Papaver nudicaule]
MEIDLTPKSSKYVYGGEGGSYFSWSPSDYEGNTGASKVILQKNGLAMTSYTDSAKVAYVLQGSGTAGIILYEAKKEKVIAVTVGDAIALPFGVVTWWFNQNDTELVVLFMGDTSESANGIFIGFTTKFVGRAWDLEEDKVKEIVGSQKTRKNEKGMALNCLEARLDVDIKNGGHVVVLNTKNLPSVEQVGLGADLVRINAGSMCSPGFSCDSAYPVTYIVQVSGRAQIVGVDGKRKMEIRVKAGNLFHRPQTLVVSKIADEEGMDWFSVISIPNPILCDLAGRTSASPDVAPEAENHLRYKRTAEIFFPTPNKEE